MHLPPYFLPIHSFNVLAKAVTLIYIWYFPLRISLIFFELINFGALCVFPGLQPECHSRLHDLDIDAGEEARPGSGPSHIFRMRIYAHIYVCMYVSLCLYVCLCVSLYARVPIRPAPNCPHVWLRMPTYVYPRFLTIPAGACLRTVLSLDSPQYTTRGEIKMMFPSVIGPRVLRPGAISTRGNHQASWARFIHLGTSLVRPHAIASISIVGHL